MKQTFQIGDHVRIQSDYWHKLAKSKDAVKFYVRNGPDHIYTVLKIDEDGCAVISKYGDWWTSDLYLELVDADEESNRELKPASLEDIL
nr:MAG TPA: hypothetical protein [Caudoviricetes sp.]